MDLVIIEKIRYLRFGNIRVYIEIIRYIAKRIHKNLRFSEICKYENQKFLSNERFCSYISKIFREGKTRNTFFKDFGSIY